MKNFTGEGHTALVDIQGVIAADTEARADYIVTGLRDAFEDCELIVREAARFRQVM